MHVCVYVSMYVFMYACMHVCVYVCIYAWVCMYLCMHVCMCVCIDVCMCVCMYVCMHVCVCMYILCVCACACACVNSDNQPTKASWHTLIIIYIYNLWQPHGLFCLGEISLTDPLLLGLLITKQNKLHRALRCWLFPVFERVGRERLGGWTKRQWRRQTKVMTYTCLTTVGGGGE